MTNLEPQNYSQIFIRPSQDMKISQELPMGIYALKGDGFKSTNERIIYVGEENDKAITMTSKGYSIDRLEQGGFVLLTQNQDRLIKANGELARMQIRQGALDESGNLKSWIKEVLLAVKDFQI